MELHQHYSMLLGLTTEWKVEKVELQVERRRVDIWIEWVGKTLNCPVCGEPAAFYDLRDERIWRHLDTMQFETVIHCRVPRTRCEKDGVKTVKTPWAGKHGRFTLLFEAFAVEVLLSTATVEDARKLLKLNWQQVRSIQERAVERGLKRRGEEKLERIGLDEKSFGKGHDYISVMSDLGGGRVLEVEPGRKQESARQLLGKLSKQQRDEVFAVAMDMWPAFMSSAAEMLPKALVVHDKFHVSKHLNEAVDRVRRQEHKELMKSHDERLKGAKYLFLKRPTRLTTAQRERFEHLRSGKLRTARAWAIKDMFDEFWTFDFVSDTQRFFQSWWNWAVRSRLRPIREKAKMFKKHLKGLLNYTIHSITNAVTEGLNCKIQLIKASARGFRSFKNYRTAILFYCGKLDMMPEIVTASQKS